MHPKWQKKRLQVLNRDGFKCRLCDDTETALHVHHLKYTQKLPQDEPIENLITYCSDCHSVVEYFKQNNNNVVICKVLKFTSPQIPTAFIVKTTDNNLFFGNFNNNTVQFYWGLTEGYSDTLVRFIENKKGCKKTNVNVLNNG